MLPVTLTRSPSLFESRSTGIL